ncbi:MAG: hypothetical protein ACE5GX_19460, partial [Thermoanaerobaculia bacterium]
MNRRSVLPVLALLLAACSPPDESPPAALAGDHSSEIEEWRAKRDASLRKDDGWLTLVGLHWLEEGDNAFGAAE